MSKLITLKLEQPAVLSDDWLIVPRPVTDWQSRCVATDFENIDMLREIEADNTRQRAFLVKPVANAIPRIQYKFADSNDAPDEHIWQLQDSRYTCASDDLAQQALRLTRDIPGQKLKLNALIDHTAECFGYAHTDIRFNDGKDEVPTLCGTTKGSCVDINTYLLAAARSIGLKVQYIAGYWFHPDKTSTRDMHCWLVFECEGERIFWDVAHHLKWGVEPLAPGLNPAGGRRVPMTVGRRLIFTTPNGNAEISHFGEPLWISSSGELAKPQLEIFIEEH